MNGTVVRAIALVFVVFITISALGWIYAQWLGSIRVRMESRSQAEATEAGIDGIWTGLVVDGWRKGTRG